MGTRLDAVGRCVYWYRDQLLTIFIALIFLPLPLLVPTDVSIQYTQLNFTCALQMLYTCFTYED